MSCCALHVSSVKMWRSGLDVGRGLTADRVRPKQISDNESVNKFVDNYLWLGETVMDQSVAFMSSSKYFERRR